MNAQTEKWFQEHRLTVIVGHSGSGKTELSVNLALWLAHTGQKTALADLDVVNPYFRSRERADLLDENGIRLITSSQACMDADLPSMPVELNTLLDDKSLTGILDIGGDAVGARVLARYKPKLTYKEYELLKLLMSNAGIVTARDTIMERIWGIDFEGESRTLDMHIKTLRKKLGEAGSMIKTVRNVGYIMSDKEN